MPIKTINADKPHLWKSDIAASRNLWFLHNAQLAVGAEYARTLWPIIHRSRQQAVVRHFLLMRGYEESLPAGSDWERAGIGTFRFGDLSESRPPNALPLGMDALIIPRGLAEERKPIALGFLAGRSWRFSRKSTDRMRRRWHDVQNWFGDYATPVLLMSGVLDAGQLGQLAADGIDWIWEHRPEQLGEIL